MNIQFYLEKLFGSDEFAKFKKDHSKAFLCGGFFIIDRENLKNPDNKAHLDFFDPEHDKKVYSFHLHEKVDLVEMDFKEEKIPSKVSDNWNFEFEEIEDLIRAEMKKKEFKNKIHKFLFSFQSLEGRDYFVGTVFLSKMGILKVNVDLFEMKITDFEKKSFFDVLRPRKK